MFSPINFINYYFKHLIVKLLKIIQVIRNNFMNIMRWSSTVIEPLLKTHNEAYVDFLQRRQSWVELNRCLWIILIAKEIDRPYPHPQPAPKFQFVEIIIRTPPPKKNMDPRNWSIRYFDIKEIWNSKLSTQKSHFYCQNTANTQESAHENPSR